MKIKKIDLKEKLKRPDREKPDKAETTGKRAKREKKGIKDIKLISFRKPAKHAGKPAADGSFAAMVHSTQPILKLREDKKQAVWQTDLVLNLSCAILVTAAIAIFCMCTGSPELVPFALTCPLIFLAIATTGSVKPGNARWIAAGVAAVVLLATGIIWMHEIFGGIGIVVNSFYDAAEEAQAYLYDRLPAGPEGADKAGVAWMAGLIGLITALPPVKVRRGISALIAMIVMLALAYYGLIPSAVFVAVMTAALIVAVSRGNFISFVPVILVALVLFGAVMLIDPGENYGISRMDENFRDRFALKSALLETGDMYYDEEFEDEEYYDEEYEDEEEYDEEESDEEFPAYTIYGLIIFAVLALGAAAFLIYRRISRKRAFNRKGIDSKDAREAITAMFPYACRWLQGYGIEQPEPSFESMAPALQTEFSESYATLFSDMYSVWNEATYSDHEVSERTRLVMETFMKDTIEQVNKKCKFMDKLKLKLKYAL